MPKEPSPQTLNFTRPESLLKVVRKYVPDQLIAKIDGSLIKSLERSHEEIKDNGESIVQKLLENSAMHLRMYGSAPELTRNLNEFNSFNMQYDYFDMRFGEDWPAAPPEDNDLSVKLTLTKYDVVTHCYKSLCQAPEESRYYRPLLAMLFKAHAKTELKRVELVSLHPDEVVFLGYEFEKAVSKMTENLEHLVPTFAVRFAFVEELIEFADTMMPMKKFINKLSPTEMNAFGELVAPALLSENYDEPAEVVSDLYLVFKCLEAAIAVYPKYFLPRTADERRTVRVFKDVCQIRNVIVSELEDDDSSDFGNVSYLKLVPFNTIHDHPMFKKVKFCYTSVKRAKHSAVPILVTPGNFFKLAFDVFLELFRELIFCHKIFQTPDVPCLETFFDRLKQFFDAEKTNGVYMMNLRQTCVIREHVSGYFEQLRDKQLKFVRNAKSDGFTVENLKNELKNLGVDETLPNILDYAEIAFAEVNKTKKESVLRTCDLFDAVEHCQLIAALQRFPNLVEFVHSQRCCKRVLLVDCEQCDNKKPKMFQDSVWKDVKLSEVSMESMPLELEGVNMTKSRMKGPDGLDVFYNNTAFFMLMSKSMEFSHNDPQTMNRLKFVLQQRWSKIRFEQFILDHKEVVSVLDDLIRCYPCNGPVRNAEYFENNIIVSMEQYVKRVGKKNFYLRTFSDSPVNEENQRRVLVSEVMSIASAAYHLYKDRCATNYRTTWRKYVKAWGSEQGLVTIGLDELKSFFDEMDFDKKLITIVPDIAYASAILANAFSIVGTGTLKVHAPDYEWMLSVPEAQFQIFQYVICDVDWNVEVCKSHSGCKENLRKAIISEMRSNAELKNGSYMPVNSSYARIMPFQTHCNYSKRKKFPTPTVYLFGGNFNDAIRVTYFLAECEKYKLTRFNYQIKTLSQQDLAEAVIPVWKARILFMLGWADMFFDEANADLKDQILKSLMWRVPLLKWGSEEDFMTVILGTSEDKLRLVKEIEKAQSSCLSPKMTHPTFPELTWESRTNIIRSPKWEAFEVAHRMMAKGSAIESPQVQYCLKKAVVDLETLWKGTRAKRDILEQKSLSILREVVKVDEETVTAEKDSDSTDIDAAWAHEGERLEELTAEVEKLAKQHVRAAEKIEKLKTMIEERNSKVQTLETSLKESKNNAAEFAKKCKLVEELNLKIKESEKERKSAQKRANEEVAKKNKTIAERDARIDKLMEDNQCAQKELARKDRVITEKNSEISNLKKEIETRNKEASNAQKGHRSEISQKDARIAKLEEELREARKQEELFESAVKLISEKETTINILADSNNRLQIENDEKEETIKTLYRGITSMTPAMFTNHPPQQLHQNPPPTFMTPATYTNPPPEQLHHFHSLQHLHLNPPPTSTTSATFTNPPQQLYPSPSPQPEVTRRTELSPEMKNTLRQLQHTRDTLLREQPMRQATDTARRLITMADDEEVKKGANLELKRIHKDFRNFIDAVDTCIEMIQNNVEITREDIPPLPKFPTFSEKFMNEYETAVKKPAIVPEGELADPECLICLQNMTAEQQTIKCGRCKRRYHSDCAAVWLEVKSVCPTCNGGLLNPEEFPSLG